MTEQHLVYRIEDASGLGPFQREEARRLIDAERYNYDVLNYPDPRHDKGLHFDLIYERIHEERWAARIGCCSAEQLQHWFDAEDCQALASIGYLFVTYRVQPEWLVQGELQAVFDKHHAEVVSKLAACALWAIGTETRLAA